MSSPKSNGSSNYKLLRDIPLENKNPLDIFLDNAFHLLKTHITKVFKLEEFIEEDFDEGIFEKYKEAGSYIDIHSIIRSLMMSPDLLNGREGREKQSSDLIKTFNCLRGICILSNFVNTDNPKKLSLRSEAGIRGPPFPHKGTPALIGVPWDEPKYYFPIVLKGTFKKKFYTWNDFKEQLSEHDPTHDFKGSIDYLEKGLLSVDQGEERRPFHFGVITSKNSDVGEFIVIRHKTSYKKTDNESDSETKRKRKSHTSKHVNHKKPKIDDCSLDSSISFKATNLVEASMKAYKMDMNNVFLGGMENPADVVQNHYRENDCSSTLIGREEDIDNTVNNLCDMDNSLFFDIQNYNEEEGSLEMAVNSITNDPVGDGNFSFNAPQVNGDIIQPNYFQPTPPFAQPVQQILPQTLQQQSPSHNQQSQQFIQTIREPKQIQSNSPLLFLPITKPESSNPLCISNPPLIHSPMQNPPQKKIPKYPPNNESLSNDEYEQNNKNTSQQNVIILKEKIISPAKRRTSYNLESPKKTPPSSPRSEEPEYKEGIQPPAPMDVVDIDSNNEDDKCSNGNTENVKQEKDEDDDDETDEENQDDNDASSSEKEDGWGEDEDEDVEITPFVQTPFLLDFTSLQASMPNNQLISEEVQKEIMGELQTLNTDTCAPDSASLLNNTADSILITYQQREYRLQITNGYPIVEDIHKNILYVSKQPNPFFDDHLNTKWCQKIQIVLKYWTHIIPEILNLIFGNVSLRSVIVEYASILWGKVCKKYMNTLKNTFNSIQHTSKASYTSGVQKIFIIQKKLNECPPFDLNFNQSLSAIESVLDKRIKYYKKCKL